MSNSIILAFDTSTSTLSAALYNKGGKHETVINCGDKQSTSQQSSLLIPTLNALLEPASLGYEQIHYFAVTRGPGSFTGIRIGLATAQGLHLATQIPCFTPTTLQVIAFQGYQQIPQAASFLALMDNKRGQFYGQIFTADLHEKEPAQIWSFEALQTYLEQSPDHYLINGIAIAAAKERCLVPQASLATGLIDLFLFLRHKGEIVGQELSPFYLVNPVYAKRHPPSAPSSE